MTSATASPAAAVSTPQKPLPPGFIWGVSTSSYQIEGAARVDGRGDSIWDTFGRQAGRVTNNDTGDIACDHYHRYAEDIALMRDLGVAAYRFSVAWPRVLPLGRGVANEAGLDFYDRLVDALLAARIEPWLCLYHWDLPQALGELGGWQSRDIAGWFADYAALVARRYGDRVKRFATFNEPGVFTLFGYGFGWHAPGIADRAAMFKAVHHVNLAHGCAVDVLRACVPGVSLGAVHNRQPCVPASDKPEDQAAAAAFAAHWNEAFPEPQQFGRYPALLWPEIAPYVQPGDMAQIARPVDWFGLNHYSPNYVRADKTNVMGYMFAGPPEGTPLTSMGWPIVPPAFRDTLIYLHGRYRLPVYVLENGTGNNDVLEAGAVDDQNRINYLRGYTDALREAVAAGADVRGYFVWSLLDNFEWNSGYGQRFGLVYVDYKTLQRTPKASARWYRDMIARQTSGNSA